MCVCAHVCLCVRVRVRALLRARVSVRACVPVCLCVCAQVSVVCVRALKDDRKLPINRLPLRDLLLLPGLPGLLLGSYL